MPNYRRYFVPGGTYFFTVVSYRRRKFLTDENSRKILHNVIARIREKRPFRIVAMALLPDHLHTVWTLPPNDTDYSTRWRMIKSKFTTEFLDAGGAELPVSRSRRRRQERGIWQRRFWEHTIADEIDLKRCVDYLHWNPRKHQLVQRVRDWEHSTFHQFVRQGEYDINWGRSDPVPDYDAPEWGE